MDIMRKENYRPTSLMNINENSKNNNNNLARQIQQHIKRIIHMTKWDLFQENNAVGSTFGNKPK